MYGYTVFGPNLPFWQRDRWYLWPPDYKLMPTRDPQAHLGRSTWEFPLAPTFYLQIGQEGN
jgi:hypothetical protein